MATRTIAVGGGNWSSPATWVEGAVPLASDDVVASGVSGNVTIDVNSVCRSVDLTGYISTLTHLANVKLTIGDATAGAGSVALKFVAGMTYRILDTATSSIDFISTSAIVQTVDFAGKYTGTITYNASSNGSWQYTGTHNNVLGTLIFTKGTLDINGQTINFGAFSTNNANIRTLTLGSSAINLSGIGNTYWDGTTVTNLTMTANTAVVTMTRNTTSNAPLWNGGLKDYNGLSLVWVGGGIMTFGGSGGTGAIFKNITFNGAPQSNLVAIPYIEDRFQVNSQFTITGTLTLNGLSVSRRLRMFSNTGALRTITVPSAVAVTGQCADFNAISFTIAQNLSAMTGGSGDLGANTNITFTVGTTVYWHTTTGGDKLWNEPAWWFLATNGGGGAGRVPLAQDNVVFDLNSITVADTVINANVRVLGKDITWAGVTNSPTWYFAITTASLDAINFGSITLAPSMSIVSINNFSFTMRGNGAGNLFTLTSEGHTFPFSLFLINFAGTNTLTFQDDFVCTGTLQTTGLIVGNNKNITASNYVQSSGTTTMGSGTWEVTGTGTIWSSAGTITANTSTIKISNSSISNKTFAGGTKTYNNLLITGAGTCTYTFSGNNTFNDFSSTKVVAYTLIFTTGTTTTVATWGVSGSVGNIVVIGSTTAVAFTLVKSGGGVIATDYFHISRATASPVATWNAGANSIDGGGNTNWLGFVSNPFLWTGVINNNWNTAGNWFGGVIPSVGDIAYFSGTNNINCTIDGIGANVLGINVSRAYTGTITQASAIVVGTSGFIFNAVAGTFTGATQAITLAGGFIQTSGTFTNTSGTMTLTATGSNTFIVTSGTHNANGGLVKVDGVLDAIISNTTTTRFFNFEWNSTGFPSGTFFVNNNLTRTTNGSWNADTSIAVGYLGAGIGGNGNGTGTIRMIGAGAMTLTYPYAPSFQINGVGTITLTNDIEIWGTFTTTVTGAINGFNLILKGNISVNSATITGTTNTLINGTLNQTITGTRSALPNIVSVGVLAGDITVNKLSGLLIMIANLTPTNSGKNLSIVFGELCENNYSLTATNTITVASAGASLNQTPLSFVLYFTLVGIITPASACQKSGRMLFSV